jgi:hypothetical protein
MVYNYQVTDQYIELDMRNFEVRQRYRKLVRNSLWVVSQPILSREKPNVNYKMWLDRHLVFSICQGDTKNKTAVINTT